jgi:PAS domain S-box-containing protein
VPTPARSRTIGLQALLAALPALAVLPVVAFALSLLYLMWERGQDDSRRDLAQTAATLSIALDSEIDGSTRELRRLAELPSLAPDRLGEFHAYSRALIERNDGWDNLSVVDADGRVILDAVRPFSAPDARAPAPRIESAHLRRVFETGEAALSDVHRSALDGAPAIVVSVPVVRDGRVVWALSARLAPERLSQFIGQRLLREGMLASVSDRHDVLVARSRDGARFVGQQATPDLVRAMGASPDSGTARLQTLDGASVLAAWQRMPQGWTVAIGVPVALYDAPLRRSIVTLLGFGALVLALGVAASLLLGRRISRAIEAVGADARVLAEGTPIEPRHSSITQVETLFESLRGASRVQQDNIAARARALEALRASEQRLQLAIDATEAGTFDWELATDHVEWSARTRELFGMAPDVTPGSTAFIDAVHPEDRADARAALEAALAGRADGRLRIDFRVLLPGGGTRWLDARGQAHFGTVAEHSRAVRLVGVVIDQTERQQRMEALHDADRRKDEFLAMLAHELRNPLAPLRNAVSLLFRTVAPGTAARRAVEMSDRQVRHMTRLVNDLLDVSRITQGKIELRRESVAIGDAVAEAVEAIRPMVEQRGQTLDVSLPAASPVVFADAVRIAQVLENLLSNASKYTDRGGSIALRVEVDDADVLVRVSDTGIGIDRDHLARVFDLFIQIDATDDRSQGGLGIGLSLVKRLVELHGGCVSAHSDGPGCGTCFVVRLPREVSALAA